MAATLCWDLGAPCQPESPSSWWCALPSLGAPHLVSSTCFPQVCLGAKAHGPPSLKADVSGRFAISHLMNTCSWRQARGAGGGQSEVEAQQRATSSSTDGMVGAGGHWGLGWWGIEAFRGGREGGGSQRWEEITALSPHKMQAIFVLWTQILKPAFLFSAGVFPPQPDFSPSQNALGYSPSSSLGIRTYITTGAPYYLAPCFLCEPPLTYRPPPGRGSPGTARSQSEARAEAVHTAWGTNPQITRHFPGPQAVPTRKAETCLSLEIHLLRWKERNVQQGGAGPSLALCALSCERRLGQGGKCLGPSHTLKQELSPEKSHIPLIVICTPLSPLGPFSSVTWSCAFEAASVNFLGCVNGLQVYSLGHQP